MIDLTAELFKKADKGDVKNIIYITQGVLAPPFEGVEFGMAEKTVEEAIAMATGFSKEEVTKVYRKKGDMGLAAEEIKGRTKAQEHEGQQADGQLVLRSNDKDIGHVWRGQARTPR